MGKQRLSPFRGYLQLVLPLFLLCLFPGSPQPEAQAPDPWLQPETFVLREQEKAFRIKDLSNMADGAYLMCRWGDGWLLAVNFIHYRSWFVNQWHIQVLLVNPDNVQQEYAATFKKGEPLISGDRLSFRAGDQSLEGTGNTYKLKLNIEGFRCNLRFTGTLNSWAPGGDGYTYHSKNKKILNYRSVLSPWAEVNGELSTENQHFDIRGQGYVDKSLATTPVTQLSPYLYALRLYQPESVPLAKRWYLNIFDTASHPDLNARRMPFLILAQGGKWLLTTPLFEFDFRNFTTHKPSGYEYPRNIFVTSRSQGFRIQGVYTTEALVSYLDILEQIPAWVRKFVLLLFDRPVRFYFMGTFRGTVTFPDGRSEPVTLTGPFTYMLIR